MLDPRNRYNIAKKLFRQHNTLVSEGFRSEILPKLTDEFLKNSSLTLTQVETVQLSKRVKRGEITVRQAGQMKTKHTAQPGSYYRVLDQARGNLRRTVYTLLVASRLHLIGTEDLVRLLKMVQEAPEDMADDNFERFTAVVNEVVRRLIVI